MDESQAPSQPFLQQGAQQPQQPPSNQLGGIMQGGRASPQQQNITKQQVIAGLHHLQSFQKEFAPLLNSPILGKGNIRPKVFDAAATLIGAGIFSVPEVMNGIKDLPEDPLDQKKWLITKITNAGMAEKKLLQDYIGQGPGQEPEGPEYSDKTHKDHMAGLMGNYKRG